MISLPAPHSAFPDLVAALTNAAEHSRDELTFVTAREEESAVSFRELHHRARRVAGALYARGIRSGDRVALVLPTGSAFVETFFGILCAGAVPVPLYPPVRLGRMDEYHRATARMLTVSGARLVITEPRIRMLLGQALAIARPELGSETAASLLEENASPYEVRPGPEALGLVQFSSGSTVDPKPVALTHANLIAQCAVLKHFIPEREGVRDLGVSWLPLYHDMGLIGCLLLAVYYPGPLVLLPPEAFLARPALWLRAISRHRATVSPAPNFAYGLCVKRVKDEELEGVDLSSWTYAHNGAEPVSVEAIRRFAERFAPYGFRAESMMPVYGLSEASLAVTFSPRRSPARFASVDADHLAAAREVREGTRRIASVGIPVPGVEVEVRDEDGHALGEGRVGGIFVRGPSVMREYLGNPEATARALKDGWLDTGDLGFWSGGELHVCGRAKDLVIIRGANHAPQEFEDCLEHVEGVRTGCAVALGFVPDEGGSEELLILAEADLNRLEPRGDKRRNEAASTTSAFAGAPETNRLADSSARIVAATETNRTSRTPTRPGDDSELIDRIRAAIVERTGIRPHTVKVLAPGTLPRTSSGKLRRGEALRRYLAGELTAPKPVNVLTVAAEMAKSAAALALSKVTR